MTFVNEKNIYAEKINKTAKLPEILDDEFKEYALTLLNIAVHNGFDIKQIMKDGFSFTQSKKYNPKNIAAGLIYFVMKKRRKLRKYATRANIKELIRDNLDYTRITTINNPLYKYIKNNLGRYQFQPYTINDFLRITSKYFDYYNKLDCPHYESVLIHNLFLFSEMMPSDFAKKLNIHGGTVNDLLKIVINRKNIEDQSVYNKILSFIANYIPNKNRECATEAFNEYITLKSQIFYIQSKEDFCRKVFEKIFGKEFKKKYPKWLKSQIGGQMHLDGYNEDLHIAFEYNGKQHYMYIPRFHKNREEFRKRQLDDRWKKELCIKHCIILIVIPYWTQVENIYPFILEKLKEKCVNLSKVSQILHKEL